MGGARPSTLRVGRRMRAVPPLAGLVLAVLFTGVGAAVERARHDPASSTSTGTAPAARLAPRPGASRAPTAPARTGAPRAAASAAPKPAPSAKPVVSYPYPLPAPAVAVGQCHAVPPGTGVLTPGRPIVADNQVPGPVPVSRGAVDLAAARGTGVWLVPFEHDAVDADGVVAAAVAHHVRSLWVRTGSSVDGLTPYAEHALSRLLPLAHAHGLAVIAWDFPTLSDPAADARRGAATVAAVISGERVDGFAADLETGTEGVHLSDARVAAYWSRLRAWSPGALLVAVVPRATDFWLANYPYATEARYADVFAPMDYWGCNEPGAATAETVTRLARWLPVHVIGQAFDLGPYGGPYGVPSGAQVWRFLDVARRTGAIGASLYELSGTGPEQYGALGAYPWG